MKLKLFLTGIILFLFVIISFTTERSEGGLNPEGRVVMTKNFNEQSFTYTCLAASSNCNCAPAGAQITLYQ